MNTNNNNNDTTLPRTSPTGRAVDPISQLTETTHDRDDAASPEVFDDAAEMGGGEDGWTFPDPGLFPSDTPQPLARTRGQQQRLLTVQTATPPARTHANVEAAIITAATAATPTIDTLRQDPPASIRNSESTGRQNVSPQAVGSSALIRICTTEPPIRTAEELAVFLQWQSNRRKEVEEQKRFREDAAGYSQLLVFAAMRKKLPYIHLIHSVGIYPNVPGADRD
jgi:hypothetical protein